jgi:hypothetical protein
MRKFYWLSILVFSCVFYSHIVASEKLPKAVINDLNNMGLPLEEPLFANSKDCLYDPKIVVKMVEQILKNRILNVNYDRVQIFKQLLDHIQGKEKKLLESVRSFDPSISVDPYRGSACVGMTLDLLKHLPPELNGYVVAAKLPKKFQQDFFPEYCHTAILIQCIHNRGKSFVLLDPAFDIVDPIVLEADSNPVFIDMNEKGIWSFELIKDSETFFIKCSTNLNEKENPDLCMIYRTDQLLNPVPASAVPMCLGDRKPSLLSRDIRGHHVVHLNLDFNNKRILISRYNHKEPPISFEEFMSDDSFFKEDFSMLLGFSSEELNSYLKSVIEKVDVINELYFEYKEYINKKK